MNPKSPVRRLTIRGDKFKNAPELKEPLNDALISIQDQLSQAVDGVLRLRLLPPVDLRVDSNTPGTAPWPLRLAQVSSAPVGIALLRVERLDSTGSTGVPTTPVSVTSFRVEAQTLLVDFVSGLTLNGRYRLVFGAYDGA